MEMKKKKMTTDRSIQQHFDLMCPVSAVSFHYINHDNMFYGVPAWSKFIKLCSNQYSLIS